MPKRGWVSFVAISSVVASVAAQPAPDPTAGAAPTAPPAASSPPAATAPPPPRPPAPGAYPHPYPYPYPYPYPPYPPYPPPGYAAPPPPQPPAELPYEDGEPVPPGYRLESRIRRGPVIAGTIMFAVTYGINITVASFAEDESQASWLWVPGVGTWPLVDDACEDQGDDSGCEFLIAHSLTHTLGLGLLIYGIAVPKRRLVRDASIDVVPLTFAGGGAGLGVTGVY